MGGYIAQLFGKILYSPRFSTYLGYEEAHAWGRFHSKLERCHYEVFQITIEEHDEGSDYAIMSEEEVDEFMAGLEREFGAK